jgi:SAM-dependent methyltransferase
MRHMYEHIARMIPRRAPVVDLGCGNGYLAMALSKTLYEGEYIGYDFSPVAVEQARAALIDNQLNLFGTVTPQYQFEVQDLREWTPLVTKKTHTTVFTCFEVLEHVDEDCDIVRRVPARSRFIFSVPNYWSDSHVRTYDTVGAAYDRYGVLLKFNAWKIFPTKQPEAAIHLYDTIRRADKW